MLRLLRSCVGHSERLNTISKNFIIGDSSLRTRLNPTGNVRARTSGAKLQLIWSGSHDFFWDSVKWKSI